jgi:type I restriction enzyme S subunit
MTFQKLKIKDICDFVGGAQPPKEVFISEEREGYIRLIQTRDYKTDAFKTYIPKNLARRFCNTTDIMIGRYGPPIFQILRGLDGAYNVALMKAVPKSNVLNDYLYYIIKQKNIFEYVDRLSARTGGQTGVDLDSLNEYPVLLPDKFYQQKVLGILKGIDDKIEINNRINAELEAMAKAIYNYWFVQFDFPISKEQAKAMGKPKLEGKPYRTSGGKMVWSEVLRREMPECFKDGVLNGIARTGSGGTPKSTENLYYDGGNIPWINSGEVNQPFIVNAEKFITEKGFENSSARIFPKGTILMAMYGATAGKVSLMDIDACTNQAICAVMPNEQHFTWYIKSTLEDLYKYLVNLSSGSARDNLSQDKIRSLKFVIPPDEVLKEFHDLINPMMLKALGNLKENLALAELRDWLLPLLMNGQVRIKETTQSEVVKPAVSESKPANSYFYQTQLVAAIVNASKKHKITHGEMTLAKYTYLVDKLYGVPTYFNYERLHLGPYPKEMKKIVNNRKFFKIQNNEISVVPQKTKYSFQFQQQVEDAITDLASIFSEYKGKERPHQTELLATVCKVVEDIKSTDVKEVRESMKNWRIGLKASKFQNKAEKFSESETNNIIALISKKDWLKQLLPSP